MMRGIFIRSREGWAAAGLYGGPIAWMINTQFGYAAVPWACGHGVNIIPIIAAAAALLALVTAFMSWRAYHGRALSVPEDPRGGRPYHLLAGLGIALGVLFALVILTQGAAGFFLQGCER